MSLVKYNPFRPVRPLDFSQLFDDISGKSFSQFLGSDFISATPSVNVIEDNNAFSIEVAAPGLSKEDFQIEVENDTLVISASKTEKKEESNEGNFKRREFNYSSFKRSFHLSDDIAVDNISATYANGILTIHLAKVEKAPEKKTTIKVV